MKQFILITTLIFLGSFYLKAFSQVNQFPYLESFENEIFTEGTNVYFINNWFGNFVDGTRVFLENVTVKSGTHALGLWPIVEEGEDDGEVEIIAQVDLDLTGLENVVSDFWVATVATGAMKHIKLYMMISLDGGLTFGPRFIMGTDHRGFANMNTSYKEFIFALHPNAFNNPNVVLRFMAKAGAKSGYAAKILIDDVSIYAAPEDIFPPIVADPSVINVNQIQIQFSEPLGDSALDPNNYIFINATPLVDTVTLTKPDLVTLNLSVPIQIGKYYDLQLSNIKDLAGNTMLTNTFTLVFNPLTEGLVITEIMYDEPPPEQNDNLEFIELYNITESPIELGGLMIKGGITSGKLPEYTLQPNSFWVTSKNAAAFSGFFGVSSYQWHGANLSNDEPESIFIVNTMHHSGTKIDYLTYGNGPPWPEGAAGLGHSMELIDPLADNSDPSNWKSSTTYFGKYNGYDIYATPGAPNSTLGIDDLIVEKPIRLYPNPVTDFLTIDSNIQPIKVELYSIFGKKIKEINSDFKFISTHTLSDGMYIVKVYFENSFVYKKIIKD